LVVGVGKDLVIGVGKDLVIGGRRPSCRHGQAAVPKSAPARASCQTTVATAAAVGDAEPVVQLPEPWPDVSCVSMAPTLGGAV
jgi:hypothetical protein